MPQPQRKRKRYDNYSIPMQVSSKPRRNYQYNKTSEMKWFDRTVATTVMASTGTVLASSINLINEGNGVSEMAGRKVVINKV